LSGGESIKRGALAEKKGGGGSGAGVPCGGVLGWGGVGGGRIDAGGWGKRAGCGGGAQRGGGGRATPGALLFAVVGRRVGRCVAW